MYDFICPHARVLVLAMELFCMEKFDQLGTGFVEGVLSTFYTIIFASILMGFWTYKYFRVMDVLARWQGNEIGFIGLIS